jgi:hypothetical protein
MYVARPASRRAWLFSAAKSTEIRQRQRQHQAHDKNYDRKFEQREARRCGFREGYSLLARNRDGALAS